MNKSFSLHINIVVQKTFDFLCLQSLIMANHKIIMNNNDNNNDNNFIIIIIIIVLITWNMIGC